MKRFKALYPRLGLIVAGVAVGLLARQVLGPPADDTGPSVSIDRPIGEGVDLDSAGDTYIPLELPVEPLEKLKPSKDDSGS